MPELRKRDNVMIYTEDGEGEPVFSGPVEKVENMGRGYVEYTARDVSTDELVTILIMHRSDS